MTTTQTTTYQPPIADPTDRETWLAGYAAFERGEARPRDPLAANGWDAAQFLAVNP